MKKIKKNFKNEKNTEGLRTTSRPEETNPKDIGITREGQKKRKRENI